MFPKIRTTVQLGGLIITFTISLPKEMFYLQRKYKIETEVENWIQKYDTDMGERQVRLIYIYFFFTQENNKEKSHRLGSFV